MGPFAVIALQMEGSLHAAPTFAFDCSISATGNGINLSSYSGPGDHHCGVDFQDTWAIATGSTSGIFVVGSGPGAAVHISLSASLTQSETLTQMLIGGSGDATLRINYRWRSSVGMADPPGYLGLTNPAPAF